MGGVEIEDLEAGDEVVGAAGRDHHLRSRNIFVFTLRFVCAKLYR